MVFNGRDFNRSEDPIMKLIRMLLPLTCVALSPQAMAQSTPPGATIVAKITDADGNPIADAVIVATPSDGALPAATHPRAESLDQIDKEFVPKVKPILVGSTVAFPNKD